MKYDYNLYPENNPDEFKKARRILREAFPGTEQEPLIDVDGSITMIYQVEGKKICLNDDYYIGAVYVESDIDLSHLFNKLP